MTDDRDPKLDTVLADLQTRYGGRIIAPARPSETVRLPTGIAPLDEQLAGGLALRKLTQISGRATSGATSLVLRAVARTQADGGHVVYLDLAGLFDPVMAQHCGVDLPALLLMRRPDENSSMALVRDLLASGSSSLIVLDAYDTVLKTSPADARRVVQAVSASSSAVVLLGESLPAALGTAADTRLQIDLLGWLRRGERIAGLHSRATIADARGGERSILLELRYEKIAS